MARWPALARRAWRPNPLLADIALALVLAALSLLTLEGQQGGRPARRRRLAYGHEGRLT